MLSRSGVIIKKGEHPGEAGEDVIRRVHSVTTGRIFRAGRWQIIFDHFSYVKK